jgi:hypothetical protein
MSYIDAKRIIAATQRNNNAVKASRTHQRNQGNIVVFVYLCSCYLHEQ